MNAAKTVKIMILGFGLATHAAAAASWQAAPDFPAVPLKMANVTGVAIDNAGLVYVAGGLAEPVLVFDRQGKLLRQWGSREIKNKHGLRIYRDCVWVTDIANHQVFKYTLDGRLMMTLGEKGVPGADAGHFNAPTDVAVAPDGSIYVADGYGNSRIVCLAPDGQFKFAWGNRGTRPGEFNMPHNLLIGADGKIYVADRGNDRIQLFTPDGRFLAAWIGLGKPFGLGWAPDGKLLVTVVGRDRDELLELDIQGNVRSHQGRRGNAAGEFRTPHSVAATKDMLIVGEAGNQRVQRFVPAEKP